MSSTIEYSTDDGTSWTSIDYNTFSIERGNGRNKLAPECLIDTHKDCPVSVDDLVRVKIDGSRVFEGFSNSNGVVQVTGSKRLSVRGYGYDVMEERISLDLSSTSPENVLSQAVSGTDYSISTSTATGITLDYVCERKKRKHIFDDMIDRTGYIYRITPDKTIHFEEKEDQGSWQSLTVGSDEVVVDEWDEADADTIINHVVVHGTGNNADIVETDSDYSYTSKKHSREYNFNYITSSSEASSMASQLLQPSPLSKARIIVAEGGFSPSIYDDLVNYTISLTDSSKSISSEVLVVEKQVVMEGRVELSLGEGSSFSINEYNREVKSNTEKNKAGNEWSGIYDDGDMPADNATENKTVVQSSEPATGDYSQGDIWIDSDTGTPYVHDGSSWNRTIWASVRSDPDAPEDNATKNDLIRQSSEPNAGSYSAGDMWVDSDNGNPYIHDGTDWRRTTWAKIRLDSNAPEDNADVTANHNCLNPGDFTANHNCLNPGDFTSSNPQDHDSWLTGLNENNHHPSYLRGGSYNSTSHSLDTAYQNNDDEDWLVMGDCSIIVDPGEKGMISFGISQYGSTYNVMSKLVVDNESSNGDKIEVTCAIGQIVPAGWYYRWIKLDFSGSPSYNLSSCSKSELFTQD